MSQKDSRGSRCGFTLIEMLVTLTIGTVVVLAALGVVRTQTQLYTVESETMRVAASLRASATLLTSHLMDISAAGGDLVSIAASSLTVRQVKAAGVICARNNASGTNYGIHRVSGSMEAGDSAWVYSIEDDSWDSVTLNTTASALSSTPRCQWGDTVSAPRPEVTLTLDSPSSSVQDSTKVGSSIKAFERATYGLTTSGGRHWLSRTIGGGSTELLAGPFKAPADSGLAFSYYDSNGNTTGTPANVARIGIFLTGESEGRVSSTGRPVTDTIRVMVRLRN